MKTKGSRETKEIAYRLEALGAVALILILFAFIVPQYLPLGDISSPAIPKITGYVSAEIAAQKLNLEVDKSQVFVLSANSTEPITLTSFRLSGEVIGSGLVQIFLNDGEKDLLVYSNVKKKGDGMNKITGMVAGAGGETPKEGSWLAINPGSTAENPTQILAEGEQLASGAFDNECAETCFINFGLSSGNSYNLIFKIEPGTKLKINEVVYTIK